MRLKLNHNTSLILLVFYSSASFTRQSDMQFMLAFRTSSFLCSSSSALFINHHHQRSLRLYKSSSCNYSDADKYGLYLAAQQHNCKGRTLLCRTWKFLKAVATKSSQLLLCGRITWVGAPWLGEHYQCVGAVCVWSVYAEAVPLWGSTLCCKNELLKEEVQWCLQYGLNDSLDLSDLLKGAVTQTWSTETLVG